MRVLARISNPSCAELVRHAALVDGIRVSAFWGTAKPMEPEEADAGGRTLLVHDLMPDPVQQIDWLHRLHARLPHLSLFLLLPPHGDALRELALRGAGLPLAGVEVWTPELSPDTLARLLRRALDGRADELRLWERVSQWPLPPALEFLAEAELRFAARQASRDEVLRLAGVDYEAARREAARAGLPPPKRFVEALRLLRAVSVLERGERVKEVAPAYGFHDAERLARRMRRHFDVTPTQARALGPVALLDHLERKWFGDAVAH